MPRFYFDVTDSKGFHRDEFGTVCADMEEARQQAQGLCAAITDEELPDGDRHLVKCEVRDEAGRARYRGELTYQGVTLDPGL